MMNKHLALLETVEELLVATIKAGEDFEESVFSYGDSYVFANSFSDMLEILHGIKAVLLKSGPGPKDELRMMGGDVRCYTQILDKAKNKLLDMDLPEILNGEELDALWIVVHESLFNVTRDPRYSHKATEMSKELKDRIEHLKKAERYLTRFAKYPTKESMWGLMNDVDVMKVLIHGINRKIAMLTYC